MRVQLGSSARFGGLFWPFNHNAIARRRLRMKPQSPPGRFSTSLASAGGCANLRQNRRHDSTHLPRSRWTLRCFPGTIASLSQWSCQAQLVHRNAHYQTPAFKLLRSTYVNLCPEQVLLEITIAMFLRKASSVEAGHRSQRNIDGMIIQTDKPALAWITLTVFRSLSPHPEDANLYLASLPEMQLPPSTDRHHLSFLVVAHQGSLSSMHSLRTTALKERTIQRRPSFCAGAHWGSIELAIAFESDKDLTAQRFA